MDKDAPYSSLFSVWTKPRSNVLLGLFSVPIPILIGKGIIARY